MEVNIQKDQKVQPLVYRHLKASQEYVLLIPDSLFWVTGRIAHEINNVLLKEGVNSLICSGPVLSNLLALTPSFVEKIKLVHFLTPHLATYFKKQFYDKSIFVSTIHHVENSQSSEPASYSDAIMTVSHQWHNELVQSGVQESKLVMIQNGIDVNLFHPVSPREKGRIRRKYGLPLNGFIVGFSAKKTSDSCERKGADVLEALIKSTSSGNSSNIAWFMRGPGWNYLTESLRKEGAQIYYCPFLASDKSLAESYQALDAFVITSRIEGGPVPLLEAMSCGLPVITTKVGVAREIIEDCKNGFLVNFDAPKEILDKLRNIIGNEIYVNQVGTQARQAIVEKLQWKYTTKDLFKLYSIAENNFRLRQDCLCQTSDFDQPNRKSKAAIERWIYSRECAYFANFLASQNAREAAIRMANRAILRAPLDRNVLKSTLHLSSLRFPFQFLQSVARYLKLDL